MTCSNLKYIIDNIFSKPLAAFPHSNFGETKYSSDREMNFLGLSIINPRKEYWPKTDDSQCDRIQNLKVFARHGRRKDCTFSHGVNKFESNTTFDWLNRMV